MPNKVWYQISYAQRETFNRNQKKIADEVTMAEIRDNYEAFVTKYGLREVRRKFLGAVGEVDKDANDIKVRGGEMK